MADNSNSHHHCRRTLAIIGGGPQGLSALESVCGAVSVSFNMAPGAVTIVEPSPHLGSGPNFASNGSPSNILNIAERLLELEPRDARTVWGIAIPSFPGYQTWANVAPAAAIDTYPARRKLGEYLEARYRTLADPLQRAGKLTVIHTRCTAVRLDDSDCSCCLVELEGVSSQRFSDVLLAIGHQQTREPDVLTRWRRAAETSSHLAYRASPYPASALLADIGERSTPTVAVRGMGLAMIDVVKTLTQGSGGTFALTNASEQVYEYRASDSQPPRILPFSLDGLPPVPKPLSKAVDDGFKPAAEAVNVFARFCRTLSKGASDRPAPVALIHEVALLVAQWATDSYCAATQPLGKDVAAVTVRWLNQDGLEDDRIVDPSSGTLAMLKRFRDMSTGKQSPSLDYCVGQIWRHLQPTMYAELSYASLPPEEIAALTAVDERMKRYAFGPPVASIGQLIALADANLLSFCVVDDPDVRLTPIGWQLSADDSEAWASIMVNSVLDAPEANAMTDALPVSLLATGVCSPVQDKLGIRTTRAGLLVNEQGRTQDQIAALGRLAKGTLIGTDAILECFGARTDTWANALVNRWADCQRR